MEETIYQLVRKAEEDDLAGSTVISKYVTFSLRENIEKIDAYLNSKHISGETDSMGRDKPFFNIVTGAVNIWYRATDVDRKNIIIGAGKGKETILAFLATAILQQWMRKQNFGSFLNDWGRSLARYGSTVLKFVEKSGELHADVIPWNRLIIDPVDFENNIKIEILELTPAQLRKREGYDQEVVEKLIDSATTRQTMSRQNKDNKAGYIKLYEVHGELPLSFLTGKDKDDDTYVQQMHVISFVAGKDKGEYDDFTLVSGREKDPYMITHLIREDGRSQSIGAVENLFEAQWMMNHTVKGIKDQLDLASKLIFQTSDGNFVGQNALTNIETGEILIQSMNQPLTQVANTSHDIASLQNFGGMWQQLGREINGISDAMQGDVKSGTAWRQTQALLQESHSLFELMIENKKIHIEEMMRRFILPHIKTKLNNADEVKATLDVYGIDKIDAIYIKNEAIRRENNRIKEQVLAGEVADPADLQTAQAKIQGELQDMGGQRFYTPKEVDWKTEFKDFEWEADVVVEGESSNVVDDMASLNTAFQTVASLQGRPMSPEEKFFFNTILTKSGSVSPVELQNIKSAPQPVQPTPSPLAAA